MNLNGYQSIHFEGSMDEETEARLRGDIQSPLYSLTNNLTYDIIGDSTMEYEVTIKIKMDADYFYCDLNSGERENTLQEDINNVLHDVDDMKVLKVRVEELEV